MICGLAFWGGSAGIHTFRPRGALIFISLLKNIGGIGFSFVTLDSLHACRFGDCSPSIKACMWLCLTVPRELLRNKLFGRLNACLCFIAADPRLQMQ
jgi:hypothetical protein